MSRLFVIFVEVFIHLVFLYQALVSLQPCDICIWYLINLLTNLFIGVYVYIPVEAGTCNRGSMVDELSGILYCLLGFGFLICCWFGNFLFGALLLFSWIFLYRG